MMINRSLIEKLPKNTGVYLFKKGHRVLYVGKSVNLRNRVFSHLENSHFNEKEALLIKEVDKIDYFLVDSEFKAIVFEANLIKKYRPKYNVRWRDDKNFLYIKITVKEKYPKVLLARKEDDHKSKYLGPFSSKNETEFILREARKIAPFCSEKKISRRPCFYSKIGLCHPCPNEISLTKDENLKKRLTKKYQKNIKLLIKLLKGEVDILIKKIRKEIDYLSQQQRFEEAIPLREKLKAISYLLTKKINIDSYQETEPVLEIKKFEEFIKKYLPIKSLERIEGYDVSNLSFKEPTASMIVFTNGFPDRSQYKRFKIKKLKKMSDIEMVREAINRRFDNQWPIPDLIVVDGGITQLKTVIKSLQENQLSLPVISVAKNPDRVFILKNSQTIKIPLGKVPGGRLLIYIRDEAHRFAKKYHLLLRSKKIVNNLN